MHDLVGQCLPASTNFSGLKYSICTLATQLTEYAEMQNNFILGGFSTEDVEYIYADNSIENFFDAFRAINDFIGAAHAPYVILCHQDVRLIKDGRIKLDLIIDEMERNFPRWALLGNAGIKQDRRMALRITDPNTEAADIGGPFPQRVMSLDENFIVVKRSTNLGPSHDLTGFHMYGVDLCLLADIRGLEAYVIDFHLLHQSGGRKDRSYYQAKTAWRRKYSRLFRSRWVHLPTLSPVFLSSNPLLSLVARGLRKISLGPSSAERC